MKKINEIFNSIPYIKRQEVREQFVTDVSGVVKNYAEDGLLSDDVRNELLKVTLESIKMLQDMKKVYLHRKNILNKVVSQVKAQAAKDEKSAIATHVSNMMDGITQKINKIDSDMADLTNEADLIKKKQI